MKILVIGGTGFIGEHLVPRLTSAGHDVVVMQRQGSQKAPPAGTRAIVGDRRALSESRAALRGERPDVVVDLILSSGRQGRELVDVFSGHTGRLVVATSMDVYRATAILHGIEGAEGELEPVPLTEASRLRATSQTYPPTQIAMLKQIFGWLDDDYDKVAVERAAQEDASLAWTILRLPMIYGPRDRLHRLWPFAKRIQDHRPHMILPESFAKWRSPRGYVENIAAAVALAATDDRAARRVYNVGEPQCYSELEWARLVASTVSWSGKIVVMPDSDVPRHLLNPGNYRQHWSVDSSRIRRELGYDEPVPLAIAVRRTIEWELAHPPSHELGPTDYAAEDRAIRAVPLSKARSDNYS